MRDELDDFVARATAVLSWYTLGGQIVDCGDYRLWIIEDDLGEWEL